MYHKLTSTFMTDSRRWTIRFLPTLYSKTRFMVDNLKKKIFKPSKPIKIFALLALFDLSTILLSNTNETWIALVGSHEFPLNKKEFQRPVTRVKLWRLSTVPPLLRPLGQLQMTVMTSLACLIESCKPSVKSLVPTTNAGAKLKHLKRIFVFLIGDKKQL